MSSDWIVPVAVQEVVAGNETERALGVEASTRRRS